MKKIVYIFLNILPLGCFNFRIFKKLLYWCDCYSIFPISLKNLQHIDHMGEDYEPFAYIDFIYNDLE